MSAFLMECREVVILGNGDDRILDGVSLGLLPGECTIVLDNPDMSDTYLLRLFGLLERPASGHMYFEGRSVDFAREQDLLALRMKVAYISRASALISNLTLLDNVTLFHRYHYDWPMARAKEHAAPLLERFCLMPYLELRPAEMDVEHRRHGVVVRELIKDFRVLIMEKPRVELSVLGLQAFMELFTEWKDLGRISMLISEDDEALIRTMADRVVDVQGGRIAHDGPIPPVRGAKEHP
jgi:ABC-type transporter Mla maintaining outer membrane lipid asymmetry ATPase subunit MlaF